MHLPPQGEFSTTNSTHPDFRYDSSKTFSIVFRQQVAEPVDDTDTLNLLAGTETAYNTSCQTKTYHMS